MIEEIDRLGGAVTAIEQGFIQDRIEESAFAIQQGIESGDLVVVGVNRFREEEAPHVELHSLDPALEADQRARLAALRARRNAAEASAALEAVRAAARVDVNLLPPMRDALSALCTVGEICELLRAEWGTFDDLRP